MWSLVQNYTNTHPSVDKQLRLNELEVSHRNENGDESLDFFAYVLISRSLTSKPSGVET